MINQISSMQLQDKRVKPSISVAPLPPKDPPPKESEEAVAEIESPTSPQIMQQMMVRRESTATTGIVPMEQILPVSPRQLVSEEGGIVNLAVDNEFDAVVGVKNVRQKKLRAVNIKRTKPLIRDYDDDKTRLSPDSRYLTTAGTGPVCSRGAFNRKGTVDESKMGRREHARFLVELMSPFASRAGTQGITSVSNRSISQKHKAQYHVAKLSPLNLPMPQQSQQSCKGDFK